MAIQLPDVGTGVPADKTGDSPWLAMKKVRENFKDQTNAASRLVGLGRDDIAINKDLFDATFRPETLMDGTATPTNANEFLLGRGVYNTGGVNTPSSDLKVPGYTVLEAKQTSSGGYQIGYSVSNSEIYYRACVRAASDTWTPWVKIYNTGNTTVDSNKNIKLSSPVVRVFSDHLDKIHEANDLPVKFTRNGVGDYTIEGTTGLRENDWQIVIPKDDHDNQLIAFTMKDDNGTIRLKTYKRTFNMTTFMFEPDLNTSLDIPDGRWVDLHFNDLPHESLDDFQMEV